MMNVQLNVSANTLYRVSVRFIIISIVKVSFTCSFLISLQNVQEPIRGEVMVSGTSVLNIVRMVIQP